MNIEALREYCLSKPGVEETFPFGELTMVFKVGNKMLALAGLEEGNSVNLKCDPDKAIELREAHDEVQPGFHMNKRHWNTVSLQGRLSTKQIKEMIDDSYKLIFDSLPAKMRKEISG